MEFNWYTDGTMDGSTVDIKLSTVAYGAVLGLVVQHHDASFAYLRGLGRHSVTWLLMGTVALLAVWLGPWRTSSAAAHVSNGRLSPQWLRVAPGGCVSIRNLDRVAYQVTKASPPARLEPQQTSAVCFAGAGAKRVRIGTGAWSGGFVLVDPEASR